MPSNEDQPPWEKYLLSRGSFYVQALSDVLDILETVRNIDSNKLSWSPLAPLGIAQKHFRKARRLSNNNVGRIFSHPVIILKHPETVRYYRHVASLSRKPLTRIIGSTWEKSEKTRTPLTKREAKQFVKTVNRFISALLPTFSSIYHIEVAFLVSVGSQIEGQWKNAIGTGAERSTAVMIVKHLKEKGYILESLDAETLAKKGEKILIDDTVVEFGDDPDIHIYNARKDGTIEKSLCAIEVKGGTDPAGALERYGAALKSHRSIKARWKATTTVLLAACITPAVENSQKKDKIVDKLFDLSLVLIQESEEQKEFLRFIDSFIPPPTTKQILL